jgi:predicted ATP-dependent serine protease
VGGRQCRNCCWRAFSASGGGDRGRKCLAALAATVANAGRRALDLPGKEAAARVRLRAERLDLSAAPAAVAAEMSVPATSARHVDPF